MGAPDGMPAGQHPPWQPNIECQKYFGIKIVCLRFTFFRVQHLHSDCWRGYSGRKEGRLLSVGGGGAKWAVGMGTGRLLGERSAANKLDPVVRRSR